MGLGTYRQKRHFNKTPEPSGDSRRAAGRNGTRQYVIQKHDASRLHYDFRLEAGGVLLSWAVPKGPSLDPADKTLAVRVEDHPVEYGTFEGVIPKGEYGGGTVMLWDRGLWQFQGKPTSNTGIRKAIGAGSLKFTLKGERLQGNWMLVRMKGPRNQDGRNWLLIKENDAYAVKDNGRAILEQQDTSVASQRSMSQIANAADAVWSSRKDMKAKHVLQLPNARQGKLPQMLKPQLATLAADAPEGDDWVHEIKFDGYRIVARIYNGKVKLYTRQGNDWTDRFAAIAEHVKRLPIRQGWLDGEVVVLGNDGTSSFQSLQNVLRRKSHDKLIYYVFDIVHCNGVNLTATPLIERKKLLRDLIPSVSEGPIRYSEHVRGRGPEFEQQACQHSLEGVISKRASRPYQSGRSRNWLKSKCGKRQEFVIVGYTPPKGSRSHFGSLLLAYHDDEGKLVYCGRVGTGFTTVTLTELHTRLKKLKTNASPLAHPPPRRETREATWVQPRLVAEIAFPQWTDHGQVRQASFQGLRGDKSPKHVNREEPKVTTTTTRSRSKPSPEIVRQTIAGIRLTHADRVLYPEQGVTKFDLAAYYEAVADVMLPHVIDRPLSLVRCPRGRMGDCFYQKHRTNALPDAVDHVDVDGEPYVMVHDLAGVIGLVQSGVLEIHPWGACADELDKPDLLTFDLDPGPGIAWNAVVDGARIVRDQLEDLGLTSFVKTSGGKGLHVQVPIDRRHDWDDAKAFTAAIAKAIVRKQPDRYVATITKAKRNNRILIDYFRNSRGATSVAAYSTRSRPGAPVSMPLQWSELSPDIGPDHYTVRNAPRHVASRRNDPFAPLLKTRQSITAAARNKLGLK